MECRVRHYQWECWVRHQYHCFWDIFESKWLWWSYPFPFFSCYLTLTKYTIIYIIYIELPVHKNDTVLLYVNLVSFSEYCLLYLTIGKGRGGKGSAEGCIKLLNIIYDLMWQKKIKKAIRFISYNIFIFATQFHTRVISLLYEWRHCLWCNCRSHDTGNHCYRNLSNSTSHQVIYDIERFDTALSRALSFLSPPFPKFPSLPDRQVE